MIKTKFTLRKDVTVNNEHPLYLHITGGGHPRERVHLDIYLNNLNWDSKTQKIICSTEELEDYQLVIDNINKKLTEIRTTFRLSNLTLTPKIMREEYENKLSRMNFIAFWQEALKNEKHKLKIGSYNRHNSVFLKVREFQDYIPFNTINLKWVENYKKWCKTEKKNEDTTIAANTASIKKFLSIAQKSGIKLLIDIDDISVGNMNGNRVALSKDEMKKIIKFFFSEFINDSDKLILGYFIFGCLTGMRIGEIQKIKRGQLTEEYVSFIGNKGNKDKSISLIDLSKQVVNYEPRLFIKKFSDKHLNSELKIILKKLGITKKVTFHVSRHTFATNYLRAGGSVEKLKMLLGHSKIETTMIYVHIVNSEANEDIFRLDNYYS